MEYPLRSKLITSLYSAFICSSVFTEPTLRPSFPPFSINRFLPDCNRNEILSRSANLGKNNEPIKNRLSFLIDCKSVILNHITILLFPMVRPAWDNWWLVSVGADARIGRCGCSYRSTRMFVSVDADGKSTKKDRANVVIHMLGLSVLCVTNRVCLSQLDGVSRQYPDFS